MQQTRVIVTKKENGLFDIWFPQQNLEPSMVNKTQEQVNEKVAQFKSWGYLVEVRE